MVLEGITEAYYGVLSAVFSPILGFPAPIAEIFLASIIVFIFALFFRFLVDQDKIKGIKEKMKELQDQAKEYQKTDQEKSNKILGEVMKLSNKQMKMSFRAMIPAMGIAFLLFPWIATLFPGAVVNLPFSLPYFGADFGWLGWYLIVSIPLNTLIRRAIGVQI